MDGVSLLGVPHDDNSSYLRGSAEAPDAIRRMLHCDAYTGWSESGIDLGAAGRLVDHGDVDFAAAADPWAAIEAAVGRALDSGNPLISLGGDHAVTHPILRGIRRRHPRLTILHIDAHPDIYDAYQGNTRSHASPFARIMEEGLADRLITVGLRAFNDHHRAQFARFGVETVEADRCHGALRLEFATPVYVTIDMDALDPAYAPGVSHREPGGLSPRWVIDLLHRIDRPIVGGDIVECNPRRDIQDMTAGVAAKLLKELAGMMLKTNRLANGAAGEHDLGESR
jgi:agmatinase